MAAEVVQQHLQAGAQQGVLPWLEQEALCLPWLHLQHHPWDC